jgi:hypothetical protein
MKWVPLSAFLAVLLVAPWSGAAPAGPVALETHRALYRLSLARADTSSGINSAEGLLSVELSGGCEGYVFNEHHLMDVAYSEGGRARMDFRISTWESSDGAILRFDRKSVVDGQVAEHFRGRAEIESEGGGGRVVFSDSGEKELRLERGTIFPTEHTAVLVAGALAGERQVIREVYAGTGPGEPTHTVAFLGDTIPAAPADAGPLLAGVVSWPVRLSFYDNRPDATMPEYEVAFRLYANGIATDFELDYGSFALSGTLERLEAVPRAC